MRFLIFTFFLFLTFTLRAQSPTEVYISKFDSLALEVSVKYQIPASLVLGIALQESGAGTSKLSRTKHNHFGVKTQVRSSKTKSGYKTVYRIFDSDEAAYLHFGEMIATKKYYGRLKGNMDYMKWLKAMKAAGYAASSKWIPHVDQWIKRYDLTRFDPETVSPDMPKLQISDTIPVLVK